MKLFRKSITLCIYLLFSFISIANAEPEYRIGATLPLSGDLATYGNLIRSGIELAVEDLKAEGISIKPFFEDTPLAGAQIIPSLNRLLQRNKVQGIAGNFSNIGMAAMASTLQEKKIPSFHTAAADPLIVDAGSYIVTTNVRIKDEASHMADYIYDSLSLKKAAVLSINTNFGQAYRIYFIERFKSLGGTITADETFELSDADYRTQLSKIKNSNADALYLGGFGRFLGEAMKEAREVGISSPFFSVYESEDSSVVTAAGKSSDGLRYFVTTSVSSSPKFASFRERFMKRWNQEPGTFASNSYDATMILGHALSKCNGESDCALNEIYNTKDYQGISGTFTIESDGATRKNFILREVKEGKFLDAKE